MTTVQSILINYLQKKYDSTTKKINELKSIYSEISQQTSHSKKNKSELNYYKQKHLIYKKTIIQMTIKYLNEKENLKQKINENNRIINRIKHTQKIIEIVTYWLDLIAQVMASYCTMMMIKSIENKEAISNFHYYTNGGSLIVCLILPLFRIWDSEISIKEFTIIAWKAVSFYIVSLVVSIIYNRHDTFQFIANNIVYLFYILLYIFVVFITCIIIRLEKYNSQRLNPSSR